MKVSRLPHQIDRDADVDAAAPPAGRHFAYQELRIFLITFFHYFDVEKVGTTTVALDNSRVLMGMAPIKGKATFRLKRRETV